MKKNLLFTILFSFALLTLMLMPRFQAKAWVQNFSDGYFHKGGSSQVVWNNGSDNNISNSTFSSLGFFATTTPFTFSTITQVSILVKEPSPTTNSVQAQFYCSDGSGLHTGYSDTVALTSNATESEVINLTSNITCDSSTLSILYIWLNFLDDITIQVYGYSTSQTGYGLTYYQPSPGNNSQNTSYILTIGINGQVDTSTSISFNPAQFYDGMVTPDFYNWWLNLQNVEEGRYNYSVKWGTSTPTQYTNDVATEYGYQTITAGNHLVALNKVPTSTPGSYVAQAYLYNDDDDLIAVSSQLEYTIASGSIISMPKQLEDHKVPNCPPTDFQLLDVDFGRGLCNVARFLFVPSSYTTSEWENLVTNLENNPLYLEFKSVSDSYLSSISNATSTATTTDFYLTYNATSSPVGTLNIGLKSSLINLLGQTMFDYIYNGIGYLIWFSVGAYALWKFAHFTR